jgi:hypothetical protein
MADLNDLLVQFEQKLKELQGADELTTHAPAVFKEFADAVERRTGGDRRRDERSGSERRHDPGPNRA